jgi:hypothetical protein
VNEKRGISEKEFERILAKCGLSISRLACSYEAVPSVLAHPRAWSALLAAASIVAPGVVGAAEEVAAAQGGGTE